MSMLKVENLSVHYGMIQAVRDESLLPFPTFGRTEEPRCSNPIWWGTTNACNGSCTYVDAKTLASG